MTAKKPKLGPAAVKHGDLKLSAGWIKVTPKIAEQFLARSDNPRALRSERVSAIAEDIYVGGWSPNGETLKIDADGYLRDGQHRCAAIVEAGKACLCLVVYGVTTEGVDRTDEGTARTYNDVLRGRGESHPNEIAAMVKIARQLILYHATEKITVLQDKARPANAVLDRILGQHEAMRDSLPIGARFAKAGMGPKSSASILHYFWSLVDPEMADDLLNALATGEELSTGDPALLYRARQLEAKVTTTGIGRKERLALLIKCWNAWRTQAGVGAKLRWTRFGKNPEPFPLIDGLVQALASRDR